MFQAVCQSGGWLATCFARGSSRGATSSPPPAPTASYGSGPRARVKFLDKYINKISKIIFGQEKILEKAIFHAVPVCSQFYCLLAPTLVSAGYRRWVPFGWVGCRTKLNVMPYLQSLKKSKRAGSGLQSIAAVRALEGALCSSCCWHADGSDLAVVGNDGSVCVLASWHIHARPCQIAHSTYQVEFT